MDLLDTVRFWPISMFNVLLTSFYFAMLVDFIPARSRAQNIVSWVILAGLGATISQFSSRLLFERITPWHSFVRTLPVPLWIRFLARLGLTWVLALLASLVVLAVGKIRYELEFDPAMVATVVIALTVGVSVFAPLCACIGVLLHIRLAPIVLTSFYLFTMWSAGVWSGGVTPTQVAEIDFLLPLSAVRQLAEAIPEGDWALATPSAGVAALWTLGGLALARVVYAREDRPTVA